MDTDQLRYFRAVGEALNFTRAANSLYMSQTTLSYQISVLEKEIGTKLFVRAHSGVTLTPAGEKLLELTPNLLRSIDEAINATKSASQGISRSLRIGYLGTHEQHFLPILISNFNMAYPDIDVSLRQGPPEKLMKMLRDGELDFIYILSTDIPTIRDLEVDMFEKLPLYAIMRKDNELADSQVLDRGDLATQNLCFLSEEEGPYLNRHFMESFRKRGFDNIQVDTSATMESLMMLVEAKNYVTVTPKCLMLHYQDTLVAIPMSANDEFVYHGAAWRKDNSNLAVALFVEEGKKHLAERIESGKQLAF